MAATTTQQAEVKKPKSDVKTTTLSGEVTNLSPLRHTKSKNEPVINFDLVTRQYDDAGRVKEEDTFEMSCYGPEAERLAKEASNGCRVKVEARPQKKRDRWVKDKGEKVIFSNGRPRELKEVAFIVNSAEILSDEDAVETSTAS